MKYFYGIAMAFLSWPMMIFADVSPQAPASSGLAISFVEIAAAAQVTPTGGFNEYHITLAGVDPYITYYGQRPSTASGLATLDNFSAAWKVGQNSFADSPPNAVLYGAMINQDANKANNFYIFKLTSPPEVNLAKRQVTYTGTWIGGSRMVFQHMLLNYVSLVIN